MQAGFAGEENAVEEEGFAADGIELAGGGFHLFAALRLHASLDEFLAIADGHAEGGAGFELETAELEQGGDDVKGTAGDRDFLFRGQVLDKILLPEMDALSGSVVGDLRVAAAGAFLGLKGGEKGATQLVRLEGELILDRKEFADQALGLDIHLRIAGTGIAGGRPLQGGFAGFHEAPLDAVLEVKGAFRGLGQARDGKQEDQWREFQKSLSAPSYRGNEKARLWGKPGAEKRTKRHVQC